MSNQNYPPPVPWLQPEPPQPPRKRRKRHTFRRAFVATFGVIAALIVVIVVVAVVASSGGNPGGKSLAVSTHSTPAAPSSSAPTTSAPTPAPVPSPAGKISEGGNGCDVSLSSSLYGQNYLTAQVNASNTGNVGIIVKIRVRWPLQGFSPITQIKTVHVRWNSGRQVEFRVPITSDQVSNFQDAQIAAPGDPCSYHASITGTFGKTH